jgi:Na+-driven multidrug efflux pump
MDPSYPDIPVIVAAAKERMYIVLVPYFLAGVMDALTGHLRGRKCSLIPMFSTLVCTCVFRVLWIVFLFPHLPHTLTYLYLCYIVSWILTMLCHLVTVVWLNRREKRREVPAQ